jgi:hypothetical protein
MCNPRKLQAMIINPVSQQIDHNLNLHIGLSLTIYSESENTGDSNEFGAQVVQSGVQISVLRNILKINS